MVRFGHFSQVVDLGNGSLVSHGFAEVYKVLVVLALVVQKALDPLEAVIVAIPVSSVCPAHGGESHFFKLGFHRLSFVGVERPLAQLANVGECDNGVISEKSVPDTVLGGVAVCYADFCRVRCVLQDDLKRCPVVGHEQGLGVLAAGGPVVHG